LRELRPALYDPSIVNQPIHFGLPFYFRMVGVETAEKKEQILGKNPHTSISRMRVRQPFG
jgi:hypothetical protein